MARGPALGVAMAVLSIRIFAGGVLALSVLPLRTVERAIVTDQTQIRRPVVGVASVVARILGLAGMLIGLTVQMLRLPSIGAGH